MHESGMLKCTLFRGLRSIVLLTSDFESPATFLGKLNVRGFGKKRADLFWHAAAQLTAEVENTE